MKPWVDKLITEVREIIQPKPLNNQVFSDLNLQGKNEFLFFIKPELTIDSPLIKLDKLIELIFTKIDEYNLTIKNIRVINAAYLEKHNIIAQHYGVINKLSSNLRDTITHDGISKFEQLFTELYQNAEILGSLEFLKKYPHFTPTGLSYLWQNCPTVKLAGGTYAQKLILDGNPTYLVNGFHPRQLEHFIAKDRCIITMTLIGDTDWSIARNKLIGKTNPLEAEKGSIRRELFDRKEEFGLATVSSTWNGVHLSAGPIEGLIELMRYNSDFENGLQQKPEDYAFGRDLLIISGEEKTKLILANPPISFEGKQTSIFDLTEEKNSDDCLHLLEKIEFN